MRTSGGTDPSRAGKPRKKSSKIATKSMKKSHAISDTNAVQSEAGCDARSTSDEINAKRPMETDGQQQQHESCMFGMAIVVLFIYVKCMFLVFLDRVLLY
jgi:hypothetical protein